MDDIRSPSRDAHNAAHGDAAASNDAIRGGQPMTATPTVTPTQTATPTPTQTSTPTPTHTSGPGECSAAVKVVNSWGSGFVGELTVTAGSSAITGWHAAIGGTTTKIRSASS